LNRSVITVRSSHIQRFDVPPVGPFEQSHPPASGAQPRPTIHLPDDLRPGDTISGAITATPSQKPTTPKASFDDTIKVNVAWTLANDGGKPNVPAIEKKIEEQATSQGVDADVAKDAGQQVAAEVVPLVQLTLQRAKTNAKAKIDWSKLDATLKGR